MIDFITDWMDFEVKKKEKSRPVILFDQRIMHAWIATGWVETTPSIVSPIACTSTIDDSLDWRNKVEVSWFFLLLFNLTTRLFKLPMWTQPIANFHVVHATVIHFIQWLENNWSVCGLCCIWFTHSCSEAGKWLNGREWTSWHMTCNPIRKFY